jgi:alcohol dehydrogenase
VKRHWPRLFEHVKNGHVKPSDLVTHRLSLEDISEGYHLVASKLDDCVKTLIYPQAA